MEDRPKGRSRLKMWGILLVLLLLAGGYTVKGTVQEVQAATGFVTVGKNTYYYDANGKKHYGWLKVNGKMYYCQSGTGAVYKGWLIAKDGRRRYFKAGTGEMTVGWVRSTTGVTRFFSSSGIMQTGLVTISNKKYYFYGGNGYMARGKVACGTSFRYFSTTDGHMLTGWQTINNHRLYFRPSSGIASRGKTVIGSGTYYFDSNGYMVVGWFQHPTSKNKFYFDSSTGLMATGTRTIDGKTYVFSSTGILLYEKDHNPGEGVVKPTAMKTLKSLLQNAMMPVGNTLYVWGGGWAEPTTNFKGLPSTWKRWYFSNDGNYDWSQYMDLSVTTRAKGLDCAGFVGWSIYNTLQSTSGNPGYVVEASTMAKTLAGRGFGTLKTQADLNKNNYKNQFKPGDIASMEGHTFMILGQCSDGSLVILHATPPFVQLDGTCTPSGGYSEAMALADQYMRKYYSGSVSRFGWYAGTGISYIKGVNVLRWNRSTLADPDGYYSMTPAQILKNLFRE